MGGKGQNNSSNRKKTRIEIKYKSCVKTFKNKPDSTIVAMVVKISFPVLSPLATPTLLCLTGA